MTCGVPEGHTSYPICRCTGACIEHCPACGDLFNSDDLVPCRDFADVDANDWWDIHICPGCKAAGWEPTLEQLTDEGAYDKLMDRIYDGGPFDLPGVQR